MDFFVVPIRIMSLLQSYITSCSKLNIRKPNSAVVKTLTHYDAAPTTTLSFDGAILGPKGLEAITSVLHGMPGLTSLCLRGTAVYSLDWCSPDAGNNAIAKLVEVPLPNLSSLDLSDNALGTVAGRSLLAMAEARESLTELVIDADGVDRLVVAAIRSRVELNARKAAMRSTQDQLWRERVRAMLATAADVCGLTDLSGGGEWRDIAWEGEFDVAEGVMVVMPSGEVIVGPDRVASVGHAALTRNGTTPQVEERRHLAATFFLALPAAQHLSVGARRRLAMTSHVRSFGPGDALDGVPSNAVVCVVRGCVIVETPKGEEIRNVEADEVFVMSSENKRGLRARNDVVVALVREDRIL